ncbi:MAG: GspH/FimT family pseudopilin [Thermochromatium sp.]
MRRGARGFTLVELLVVMAIAAVMMTAVPTLLAVALPGLEMKSAARRTATILRLARESAIRRGEETSVLVDLERHRLTLTGQRSLSLPERLSLRLEAASSELIDAQRGTIRFFPDGSSTGGRLVLAHGGQGYQIGVTWLTGRIELASWSE